jgi:hypothetical protein
MGNAWSPHRIAASMLAGCAALGLGSAAAQPSADEAGVRAALARCVEAWNRHDPAAFGDACLTDDVWFSDSDDSFCKRDRGRDRVLARLDHNLRNADLAWEVVQMKPQPDSSVAVQLKQRLGMLPKGSKGYAASFTSDPAFARLRRDGDAWKVFFFTSHQGWARAQWLAVDAKPPAAAAPSVSAPATDAPAAPGTQPRAWSIQYGSQATGCFHCHGDRPSVAEDGDRGRIIASGAGAATATALRQAMATPRAGGSMDLVLADPALGDERLDAIRRWLRELRDGHAERQGGRVVIRNLRSPRDPPARLALLRAEGGWRLPSGGGCRPGTTLKGGAQCEVHLPPNPHGALVFRLAASKELQPQEVRLALD